MWSSSRKSCSTMPMRWRNVRDRVLAEQRDVLAEQIDEAARRPQRQEQQAQQRRLARAGGAGEKLEGMRASIWKVRSRRTSGPSPYRKPTFSNRTKLSSVRHDRGQNPRTWT